MATNQSTVSVGKRFGRLVVLREGPRYESDGHRRWFCRCDCGEERLIAASSLRKKVTVSCGCWMRAIGGAANSRHKHARHGRVTPEYRAWVGMITRCYNPKCANYSDYGGRGIKVCDEWRHSFEEFVAHIGFRPSRKHSIDRIDNDKGYEPGNARWATKPEQMRNRRNTRWLTFGGRTMCVSDWAAEVGIDRRTLTARKRLGWTDEEALTAPIQGRR